MNGGMSYVEKRLKVSAESVEEFIKRGGKVKKLEMGDQKWDPSMKMKYQLRYKREKKG